MKSTNRKEEEEDTDGNNDSNATRIAGLMSMFGDESASELIETNNINNNNNKDETVNIVVPSVQAIPIDELDNDNSTIEANNSKTNIDNSNSNSNSNSDSEYETDSEGSDEYEFEINSLAYNNNDNNNDNDNDSKGEIKNVDSIITENDNSDHDKVVDIDVNIQGPGLQTLSNLANLTLLEDAKSTTSVIDGDDDKRLDEHKIIITKQMSTTAMAGSTPNLLDLEEDNNNNNNNNDNDNDSNTHQEDKDEDLSPLSPTISLAGIKKPPTPTEMRQMSTTAMAGSAPNLLDLEEENNNNNNTHNEDKEEDLSPLSPTISLAGIKKPPTPTEMRQMSTKAMAGSAPNLLDLEENNNNNNNNNNNTHNEDKEEDLSPLSPTISLAGIKKPPTPKEMSTMAKEGSAPDLLNLEDKSSTTALVSENNNNTDNVDKGKKEKVEEENEKKEELKVEESIEIKKKENQEEKPVKKKSKYKTTITYGTSSGPSSIHSDTTSTRPTTTTTTTRPTTTATTDITESTASTTQSFELVTPDAAVTPIIPKSTTTTTTMPPPKEEPPNISTTISNKETELPQEAISEKPVSIPTTTTNNNNHSNNNNRIIVEETKVLEKEELQNTVISTKEIPNSPKPKTSKSIKKSNNSNNNNNNSSKKDDLQQQKNKKIPLAISISPEEEEDNKVVTSSPPTKLGRRPSHILHISPTNSNRKIYMNYLSKSPVNKPEKKKFLKAKKNPPKEAPDFLEPITIPIDNFLHEKMPSPKNPPKAPTQSEMESLPKSIESLKAEKAAKKAAKKKRKLKIVSKTDDEEEDRTIKDDNDAEKDDIEKEKDNNLNTDRENITEEEKKAKESENTTNTNTDTIITDIATSNTTTDTSSEINMKNKNKEIKVKKEKKSEQPNKKKKKKKRKRMPWEDEEEEIVGVGGAGIDEVSSSDSDSTEEVDETLSPEEIEARARELYIAKRTVQYNHDKGYPQIYHYGEYVAAQYKNQQKIERTGFWNCCGDSLKLSIKCPSERARELHIVRAKAWVEMDGITQEKLKKAARAKLIWEEEVSMAKQEKEYKRKKRLLAGNEEIDPWAVGVAVDDKPSPENLVMLLIIMKKHMSEEFVAKQCYDLLIRILTLEDPQDAKLACRKFLKYDGIEISTLLGRKHHLNYFKINEYIMEVLVAVFKWEEFRDEIARNYVLVKEVMIILIQYQDNDEIIAFVINMLQYVCKDLKRNQLLLKFEKILPHVLRYSYKVIEDASSVAQCIRVLKAGTIDLESCEEVVEDGGVRLALQVIRYYLDKNNSEVLSLTMQFLLNMFEVEEGVDDMIEENGVMEILYVLMRLFDHFDLQQSGLKLIQRMSKIPKFRSQLNDKKGAWQWMCQGVPEGDKLVHKHKGPLQSKGWCTSETYGTTMKAPPNNRVLRFENYGAKGVTIDLKTGIKMEWNQAKLNMFTGKIGYDVDFEHFTVLKECNLLPVYGEPADKWLVRVEEFEKIHKIDLMRYASPYKFPAQRDSFEEAEELREDEWKRKLLEDSKKLLQQNRIKPLPKKKSMREKLTSCGKSKKDMASGAGSTTSKKVGFADGLEDEGEFEGEPNNRLSPIKKVEYITPKEDKKITKDLKKTEKVYKKVVKNQEKKEKQRVKKKAKERKKLEKQGYEFDSDGELIEYSEEEEEEEESD